MKESSHKFVSALAALSAMIWLPMTAPTAAASEATLASTFFEWDALPVKPGGSRRNVVDAPTPTLNRLSMHITSLQPGASSFPRPEPKGPSEAALLVKEGTLEVMLGSTVHRVGPGAVIFISPRIMHNITNGGATVATYYVMDVYTDASGAVSEAPGGKGAATGRLRSTVFDCESLPRTATPTGWRCSVVSSPTLTLARFESHLTTLDPGKGTAVLADPADEVVIVKSGSVQVTIKGVACRMGAGSFYFQASDDVHQTKNMGAEPATYQVFKFVSDRTPGPPS